MIMLFSLGMILVAVLATLMVLALRLADAPNDLFEKEVWKKALSTLPASFVAAFLGTWFMIEKGFDLTLLDNFLMLVLFALGGMGSVRGLIEAGGKIIEKIGAKE